MAYRYETREHPTVANTVEVRAFDGEKQIGTLAMRTDRTPGQLTIVGINVSWDYQKQGVAKAMHMEGLKEAKKRGLLLRGDERRSPSFEPVWQELQEQREAFESA